MEQFNHEARRQDQEPVKGARRSPQLKEDREDVDSEMEGENYARMTKDESHRKEDVRNKRNW
ncbi:hypothetical protein E2C01_014077 [Portunus trituberculatus]|uniref:Uncharacterized protein n=1 Tax=Portunus trituberculatus TaxID=210409 RepID=A0A5B7DIZ9_PORTR|nr:hypothetical protein [Portunus trituberculatus]